MNLRVAFCHHRLFVVALNINARNEKTAQTGFGIEILQTLIKNHILRRSSFADVNYQIIAVFGNRTADEIFFVVGTLINQNVFGLRCAELVKIHFLIKVQIAQFDTFGGFGKTAVKET